MRILALEPFMGGSHKAFLEGWINASRHDWTLLSQSAHHWKWRMRHAPLTFAHQVAELVHQGHRWDAIFATDMLDLAQFRGLADEHVRSIPSILYFHENQLTYPNQFDEERDLHFGMSNILSALAADHVWFNSAFHRDDFLGAADELAARMPDRSLIGAADDIRARSSIQWPGVDAPTDSEMERNAPPHILWAARWEHDKNPQDFFEAIRLIRNAGTTFRLSVIGQQYNTHPPIFDEAQSEFADHIQYWGFLESRAAYERALRDADIIVSTANHEFFGLSVVEAMTCGCLPLLPQRLSYPELLNALPQELCQRLLYEGTAQSCAVKLQKLIDLCNDPMSSRAAHQTVAEHALRFTWPRRAPMMDAAIEAAAQPSLTSPCSSRTRAECPGR